MLSLSAQSFTFGQAAKGAGITEKQLRNWLARSLIELPADDDRTEANWRKFAVTDIFHIAVVARLSRYGVSIPDADMIYRKFVGSKLEATKRFKNMPQDALVAMLRPIAIAISQPLGDAEPRYWQINTLADSSPVDFDASDAPTDYALVSMQTLMLSVIRRLIALVDREGADNA